MGHQPGAAMRCKLQVWRPAVSPAAREWGESRRAGMAQAWGAAVCEQRWVVLGEGCLPVGAHPPTL